MLTYLSAGRTTETTKPRVSNGYQFTNSITSPRGEPVPVLLGRVWTAFFAVSGPGHERLHDHRKVAEWTSRGR